MIILAIVVLFIYLLAPASKQHAKPPNYDCNVVRDRFTVGKDGQQPSDMIVNLADYYYDEKNHRLAYDDFY